MRIRSLVNILVLTCVLMLMFLLTGLATNFQKFRHAVADASVAEKMQVGVNDLRFSMFETMLYGIPRAREQWQIKHAAMHEVLDRQSLDNQNLQLLLNKIRSNHATADVLFKRLTATSESGNQAILTSDQREASTRTVSTLLLVTQEMWDDATEFSRISQVSIMAAQQANEALIVFTGLMLASIAGWVWWLVRRRVLKPIEVVRKGTENFAAGNLAFRLGARGRDEIAKLAGAFDHMAQQLQSSNDDLKRQNSLFSSLLKNLPVGVFMVEAPSGKPLVANDAALKLLGRGILPDVTKQNLAEVYKAHKSFSTDPYPLEEMPILLGMKGQTTRVDDMVVERPDGTQTLLEVFGSPVADEQGRIWASLASFLDITERKLVEAEILKVGEELRQLNETLEARVKDRTERLESANLMLAASTQDLTRSNRELEQFAYVASHDLQEPLRMVVGFVQLLEKRLKDQLDAESREFMAFAVDGALRMQRLIQDILAYSRVSSRSAPRAMVDSAEVVQEALTLLASSMEKTGALVQATNLPRLMADRTQLVQLFQNLIGNAIKFCRQGTPQIWVDAYRQAEHWRFTVTDNGIGIGAEYRERIFGIFQRLHTREEYDGTGIGLAICKRIVQRHGGEIGVEDAPGGGSTFWFTIFEETNT
jgi:PAS domain S-box-containing protein